MSGPENYHARYDVIIVGAGISGLYVAREIAKAYPKARMAIAERQKGFGGRTYSQHPPGFPKAQWEMGAGRIRKDHVLVHRLLKEQGLNVMPISSTIGFKAGPTDSVEPNPFEGAIVPIFVAPLAGLGADILANDTIEGLMKKTLGAKQTSELLDTFPQRAELNTLRADLALEGFLGGGEMASHEGQGIVAEGFSALVKAITDDIQARGVTLLPRHRLRKVMRVGGDGDGGSNAHDLVFDFGQPAPKPHGTITLRADRAVVLALHRGAAAEIDPIKKLPLLKHLATRSLLRTQMIFPQPAWFADLTRVVTPARPRYILPMNPAAGTIMISQTDAEDTYAQMKIQNKDGEKALERVILDDIRKLFPERKIPKPLFFRAHPWDVGATQWLPGAQDPAKESEAAIQPLGSADPSLFLCGESWSMRQAWVEGALEHASQAIQRIKNSGLLEKALKNDV